MWISVSRIVTTRKDRKTRDFLSFSVGCEQKNTVLSTSYKQNVDNLFILWVLSVYSCE